MITHTPGPWYLRSQGSEIEIKSGIYTICMVHDYNEPHEVNVFNASLIARAPEMQAEIDRLKQQIEDINTALQEAKNALDEERWGEDL